MSDRKLKFVNGDMVEYEILPLVDQYDPILRKPATSVDFDVMPGRKIAYLSMSLMETLNRYKGLGLSANQVGIEYRICAVAHDDRIWCLINPIIIDKSPTKEQHMEGCLSFPGLVLMIGRSSWVDIEFQAANGEKQKQRFEGLAATIAQHEIDHLDGILFTDLVSSLRLERAKEKSKKMLRRIKRKLATVSD